MFDKFCSYMSTAEPAYLSVAAAARVFGLSEPTIRRRLADGSLLALQLAERGAIRIPRDAVKFPASAPRAGTQADGASAYGGESA